MGDNINAYTLLIAVCTVVFFLAYFGECLRWWLPGRFGAGVGLFDLIRARMKGVPSKLVVESQLLARESKIDLPLEDIEKLHQSGINVMRSVAAVVAANKAGIPFSIRRASALGIQGRDPLAAVQELVSKERERMRQEAASVEPGEAEALVGVEGEVAFAVPPPGLVTVDRRSLSAVSEDGFIDKGARVKVIDVKGNVAVVREIGSEDTLG